MPKIFRRPAQSPTTGIDPAKAGEDRTVVAEVEMDGNHGVRRVRVVSTPPSSPKVTARINRGAKKPVPFRGTFQVCLMDDDGTNPQYQTVEGTIIGSMGVCKFQGEWSVWLIPAKLKCAVNKRNPVRSYEGGVALAMALSHMPWHLWPLPIDPEPAGSYLKAIEIERRNPEFKAMHDEVKRIITSKVWE